MSQNYKSKSSSGHQIPTTKKSKDKPTYKIIVLGSGGVGKVSLFFVS
jgi:GTPase SAR1 family protein